MTYLACDASAPAAVEELFARATAFLGGLDVLYHVAGISGRRFGDGPLHECSAEGWDVVMETNARGVFLTNQAAVRYFLKANKKGVIVNTASLAAKVGAPLLAHYSASKFAVLGWTQALAREVAPQGIRVNALCPGFVKTSMQEREVAWEAKLRGLSSEQVIKEYVSQTPLGRLEEPEDVAGLAVFLCSDAARFMTGQGINVTGGVYMG